MFRPCLPLSTVLALTLLVAANVAHAAPVEQQPNGAADRATASPSLQGFDALATIGWGAHTGTLVDLELAPYGASFGVDAGYSWKSGFRLGAYFFHSLGRTLPQHRDQRVGPGFDYTAEASSTNGGLSLGWGVPLYCLVLRYRLGLGVPSMRWAFHTATPAAVGFGDDSSPSVGFHLSPGAALLWPYGKFEGGVGFDYLAQIKDTIPSGFIGTLFLGVRL